MRVWSRLNLGVNRPSIFRGYCSLYAGEPSRTVPPRRTRPPVEIQPSGPFGSDGRTDDRKQYVKLLMEGAPPGSVTQREHREVEEEEIVGPLIGRLDENGQLLPGDQDTDALLNLDSVSEKVIPRCDDVMLRLLSLLPYLER